MNSSRKKRAPAPVYTSPNQLTLDCYQTPFDQQKQMHKNRQYTVADRIVSIFQTQVRLILQGKHRQRLSLGQRFTNPLSME